MLALSADDVRALVPMRDAIVAVRQAFIALSAGRTVVPVRTAVPVPGSDAILLAMPGALSASADSEILAAPSLGGTAGHPAIIGAKLVSVFPQNVTTRTPIIQAVVLLFDPVDGRPLAILEGASLTALRTGAASGVATDLLALPDASIVALFGVGVQARTQLEAVCAVRPVTQIRVVGRDPDRVQAFAAWAREQAWIHGGTVLVAPDPEVAVRGADIVVTATTSPTPVFPGRAVGPGAHINAVGAFQPESRELDSDVIGRSAVFVDSRTGALAEAGDLLIPMKEGVLRAEGIRGEIGEAATGRIGRRSADEITVFKSVGNAVQDLAVAALAVRRATAAGQPMSIRLDDRLG